MTKLSAPANRLQAPASRLLAPTAPQERERFRSTAEPWRNWYKLKRWRDLRWSVFVRDLFTCQWPSCGRTHHDTSLLVGHHKRPHKGNAVLFFDDQNVMTVCKDCHDGPIQALERTRGGG